MQKMNAMAKISCYF